MNYETDTLDTCIVDDDLGWNGDYPVHVGYRLINVDTTRRTCWDIFETPDQKVMAVEAICNGLDMIDALNRNQIEQLEGIVERIIWRRQ